MRKIVIATCLATAALTLSGCVVAPLPPDGGYYGEPVSIAPPPPQYEAVGVAPIPGYLWIGGYWNWAGHRYHWVPGRWEAPRPGHVWVPHRWHQDGRNWRQQRGHWAPQAAPDGRGGQHPPGARPPGPRDDDPHDRGPRDGGRRHDYR